MQILPKCIKIVQNMHLKKFCDIVSQSEFTLKLYRK
jgi:hypothetical protein